MSARRSNDPGALLGRALTTRAREHGHTLTLGAIRARRWASATFEGERVELDLWNVESGAAWLADLPDAELSIRGHHVADLAVRSVNAATVRIEALLIRDA